MNTIEPVLDLAKILHISADPFFMNFLTAIADFVWTAHIRSGRKEEARRLEHRLGRFGVMITRKAVSTAFSAEIDRIAAALRIAGRNSRAFDDFLQTLRTMQEDGAVIEAKYAQEVIYAILKGEGMTMIGAVLETSDRRLYESLLGLLDAAERLYIDISEERKLLAPYEQKISNDPNYWP